MEKLSLVLMVVIFVLVMPIFAPIVLLIQLFSGVFSRWRVAKMHKRREAASEAEQEAEHLIQGQAEAESVETEHLMRGLKVNHALGSVSTEELSQTQHQLSIRKEIIENMNELKWKRVDVFISALNSHGRVIMRDRNVLTYLIESGMDVIWHLADHIIL